jgi:hypothetical protein
MLPSQDMKGEIMAKTICCDFDGVLHGYESGWLDYGVIPDPPVPGAIDWLENFIIHQVKTGRCKLCIYSSRSKKDEGRHAMSKWLIDNAFDPALLQFIEFPTEKPAAFITIDDRCILFEGTFDDLNDKIFSFKSWQGK